MPNLLPFRISVFSTGHQRRHYSVVQQCCDGVLVDLKFVNTPVARMIRSMELPQNALVLILKHIDQPERFSSCALVANSWNEAAAMATAKMSLDHKDGAWDPAEFTPWLQKHGQHVTSLRYNDDWRHLFKEVLFELPCANLRKLYVTDGMVQLGPDTTTDPKSVGILHAATGLTRLELDLPFPHNIKGGYEELTALQQLPNLQKFVLAIGDADYVREGESNLQLLSQISPKTLPGATLSGLTSLTSLEVRGQLTVDSLQFVKGLSKLRNIHFCFEHPIQHDEGTEAATEQPFSQLQHLSSLLLVIPGAAEGGSVLVSNSGSPALAGCSVLQQLCLSNFSMDPSVLKSLTRLTNLELSRWGEEVPRITGVDAVLEAFGYISRMKCLEQLWLADFAEPLPAQHASVYAAITASSRLQTLHLQGTKCAPGAWQHIFTPGRCPSLEYIHIHSCEFGSGFDETALQQLVLACPAVNGIALHPAHGMGGDEVGVSLLPLLQLSGLTGLSLQGVTADAKSVGVIAQLTGLCDLWLAAEHLSDVGALQLTALRQLTRLILRPDTEVTKLAHDMEHLLVHLKSMVGLGFAALRMYAHVSMLLTGQKVCVTPAPCLSRTIPRRLHGWHVALYCPNDACCMPRVGS